MSGGQDRTTTGFLLVQNLPRSGAPAAKADTEGKSLEEVIWESLTHEYAHHLVDEQHGSYFNSHLDRVRRGTYACDDE